ncbi:MAG: hypothetical protein WCA27_26625 [Candidatus Sulfotelmatobacter sp.]
MKIGVTSRIVLAVAFATSSAAIFGAEKSETSHLEFVTEYIRELAAIENLRASGEQELKRITKSEESYPIAIHTSTLMSLELGSQIRMLKRMHLNPPFDDLIPNITGFYEAKMALHQRLIEISKAFVAGPEEGVDYGKLAAEVPEIRARNDYIDQSLFESTPLIFATLIDPKEDSKHHTNHLIITKAERAKLIDDITTDFGAKLERKDQNFTIGAAKALKDYLLKKDYKSSDDPWGQ